MAIKKIGVGLPPLAIWAELNSEIRFPKFETQRFPDLSKANPFGHCKLCPAPKRVVAVTITFGVGLITPE